MNYPTARPARSGADPATLTASEGAALVRSGQLRPSDWMRACLDRAMAIEPRVHAWAFLDAELALGYARVADAVDWSQWKPAPHLAGVPLGIKDIFNTIDMPTAMGSDLWTGFTPHNDARPVSHAKWAGAVPMGKTATAEFAVHAAGKTANPWSKGRIAGTSSTGSAVAVACGAVPVAFGTQSAGSIVRPASYVGTIGYKPSFGLVARTGVLKTCDTLDTIGWFGRSVADVRLMLDAVAQRGRDYPVTERRIGAATAKRERNRGRPWRIALCKAPGWETASRHTQDRVVELVNQIDNRPDVDVVELDLRQVFADAHDTHATVYHKSLHYYFQKELAQSDKVSDIFRRITEEGARVTREQYVAATRRQRAMEDELERLTADVDVLVTHATAGEAPTIEAPEEPRDSALVWTMIGAPSISLPLLTGPAGLPLGLQLVAPRFGDYTLLDFAESLFPGSAPVIDPKD
ncbi:MAG: amidase [Alphaproteobacteria bacterium]|nr:amidase [Alphaproteobacteria bacterium]